MPCRASAVAPSTTPPTARAPAPPEWPLLFVVVVRYAVIQVARRLHTRSLALWCRPLRNSVFPPEGQDVHCHRLAPWKSQVPAAKTMSELLQQPAEGEGGLDAARPLPGHELGHVDAA